MAAPAFVAISTASRANPQSTPSAVAIPSHTNGDILVIVITTSNNNTPATAIDTPSGWGSRVDVEAGANSAVRLTCFTKVGNGSETSVDIVLSGSVNHVFGSFCAAYSGANETPDITGSTVQESGVDITAPSVTTTVVDTRVIYAYCFDDDVSTDADVDTDAGFNGTKRGYIETAGGGGDNGLATCLSDEAQAASGASNTCVFSSNADDDAGCAITIALSPSSGAVTLPGFHASFRGINRGVNRGVG